MTLRRRFPIYLLVDVSESMVGPPMAGMADGLRRLAGFLQGEPSALETTYVSVITFARAAVQVVPLTEVGRFAPPPLDVGLGTNLGAALDRIRECLTRDLQPPAGRFKGDWTPIVLLLTDGEPSDDWRSAADRFKAAYPGTDLIALVYGSDAHLDLLRQITPHVLTVTDPAAVMERYFRWWSRTTMVESDGSGEAAEWLEMPPTVPGHGGWSAGEPPLCILPARCRTNGAGYLMRYARDGDQYTSEGAYAVGADYMAESVGAAPGRAVYADRRSGSPRCPHCGNAGWAAADGAIWCDPSAMARAGDGERAEGDAIDWMADGRRPDDVGRVAVDPFASTTVLSRLG